MAREPKTALTLLTYAGVPLQWHACTSPLFSHGFAPSRPLACCVGLQVCGLTFCIWPSAGAPAQAWLGWRGCPLWPIVQQCLTQRKQHTAAWHAAHISMSSHRCLCSPNNPLGLYHPIHRLSSLLTPVLSCPRRNTVRSSWPLPYLGIQLLSGRPARSPLPPSRTSSPSLLFSGSILYIHQSPVQNA